MKYKVKYYDVWYDEVSTYECKADNENDAENVQRYKILKVKGERKCEQ